MQKSIGESLAEKSKRLDLLVASAAASGNVGLMNVLASVQRSVNMAVANVERNSPPIANGDL